MCRRLTSKSASARSWSFLPGALENSPISSKGQGSGGEHKRTPCRALQLFGDAHGMEATAKARGAPNPYHSLAPAPQSHVRPRNPPFPPSVIHEDEEKATTADLLLIRGQINEKYHLLLLPNACTQLGHTPWFPPEAETGPSLHGMGYGMLPWDHTTAQLTN